MKLLEVDESQFTNWQKSESKDDDDVRKTICMMFKQPEIVSQMIEESYTDELKEGNRQGNQWKKLKWEELKKKNSNRKAAPTRTAAQTLDKNRSLPRPYPPREDPADSSRQCLLPRVVSFPPPVKNKGGGDSSQGCCVCHDSDDKVLTRAIAESPQETSMWICSDCALKMLENVAWPIVGQEETRQNNVMIINMIRNPVNANKEYSRYQKAFGWDKTFDVFYETVLKPKIDHLKKTTPRDFTLRAYRIAQQATTGNQPQAHVVIDGNQITYTNFSRLYIRAAMLDMRFEEDGSFLGAYGYLLLYSWILADIEAPANATATIKAALTSFAFTIGFVTGTGLIDKMFGDTTKIPLLHVLKNLIKIPATVLHIIPSILYWQERSQTISTDNDNRHVIEEMYVNAFGRQFFDDIKFTHIAAVQLDRALVNLSKEKAWLQSQRDGPRVTSEPEYLKVPCVFELIPGMGQVNESSLDVTQTKNFTLFGYYPGVMSLILSRTPLLRGGGKLAGIWLGMGVTFLCALVPAFW